MTTENAMTINQTNNEFDCSGFKGRLREICLGINVSPAKRRVYLARWQEKSPESIPAPTFACVHRGPQIDTRLCNLCGIKGQPFAVLACDLHGECSLGRKHSGMRSCTSCADRSA